MARGGKHPIFYFGEVSGETIEYFCRSELGNLTQHVVSKTRHAMDAVTHHLFGKSTEGEIKGEREREENRERMWGKDRNVDILYIRNNERKNKKLRICVSFVSLRCFIYKSSP